MAGLQQAQSRHDGVHGVLHCVKVTYERLPTYMLTYIANNAQSITWAPMGLQSRTRRKQLHVLIAGFN